MGGARHGCCCWCIDLLELNGVDQRMASLDDRRAKLRKLRKKGGDALACLTLLTTP